MCRITDPCDDYDCCPAVAYVNRIPWSVRRDNQMHRQGVKHCSAGLVVPFWNDPNDLLAPWADTLTEKG